MIGKLVESLNEEQKEPALSIYGPNMILAGPGSGKTRTLVVRVAVMISKGVPANKIILFTFTKKAALEIKERVKSMIGDKAEGIIVGTYHSICNKILRRFASYLGYTNKFSIFDPKDCEKVISSIIAKNNYLGIDAKKVMTAISDYKCNMKTPTLALNSCKSLNSKIIANIYAEYEKCLKSKNAMDFDSLIFNTITLLEKFPGAKSTLNNEYQYIIADEAHDSSIMDLRLIRNLTGDNENLCIIVDNDQSIYGFRGAKIEEVMNMRNIYSNMKIFCLNSNYRSTQTIVDASRCLIKNNTEMIPKNLVSKNEEGNKIIFFEEPNDTQEADRVVKIINMCKHKYGIDYKDIAVLYRINYLARPVERVLLKHQIPYKLIKGTNFYDREEVKDIISYIKVLFNPLDDISFERSINTPKRGIGAKTFDKIINYCIENELNILEACEEIKDKLSSKARKGIEEYLKVINSLKKDIETLEPDECIENLVETLDYIKYIEDTKKDEVIEDKTENVLELINIARKYDSVEELIENLLINDEITEDGEEENKVQLLTLHSSKGLEWDVVIIIGAVEGTIPSYKADTREKVEEERRLFYVGCTRAKKLLFITKPSYEEKKFNIVKNATSRFVNEIEKQYIYKYNQDK